MLRFCADEGTRRVKDQLPRLTAPRCLNDHTKKLRVALEKTRRLFRESHLLQCGPLDAQRLCERRHGFMGRKPATVLDVAEESWSDTGLPRESMQRRASLFTETANASAQRFDPFPHVSSLFTSTLASATLNSALMSSNDNVFSALRTTARW